MATAKKKSAKDLLMEKVLAKRKDIQLKAGLIDDVTKVPMGRSIFRILPAHPKSKEQVAFWADYGQHFIKSPERNENGNFKVKSVYLCVEKTFGRECEICNAIEQMMPQASTDEELELLEESKSGGAKILVNALHRSSDDKYTPKILMLTATTFEAILGIMQEYEDITDLNDGVDIIIERTGVNINTKYKVTPARKSEPVPESVLEQMKDLQEFIEQENDDGLKRALSAVSNAVGIIESPKPKALPSKKAKVVEQDDDDMADIMEEDVVEAEYEEVKPKKKVATKKKAVVVEEEEDDLDDFEEEEEIEEVKPKKKAKAKKKVVVEQEDDDDDDDDIDDLLKDLEEFE